MQSISQNGADELPPTESRGQHGIMEVIKWQVIENLGELQVREKL